jgi:hypothetical protein
MNKLVFLIAFTSFVFKAFTQNITCHNFNLTGININPSNANEHLVSIQFNGDPNDFIGYPFIALITGASGDTIGTGNMFFFGQLGGTSQDYPVVLEANADTSQFTAMFIFLNGNVEDTCYFSFPTSAAIPQQSQGNNGVHLWPNPANTILTIESIHPNDAKSYEIYDYSGRVLLKGIFQNGRSDVNIANLQPGKYLFRCVEQLDKFFPFVIE